MYPQYEKNVLASRLSSAGGLLRAIGTPTVREESAPTIPL
jgi:hypothetical protein